MNLLTQLIGVLAMILLFVTYQINDRRKILFCHVCISICWIVHYGLLGAISVMVINIICFLRNLLFYNCNPKKKSTRMLIPVVICAAEILSTFIFWSNSADALALIGAPLQTIALYMKSPFKIRILMLTASPLWLIYDKCNSSYAGILTESIVIISIVSSIIRYDILKKQEKPAK